METRRIKKPLTLRGVLTRYLILTGACLLALLILWFAGMVLIVSGGFLYPANENFHVSRTAADELERTGYFDPDSISPLCRWALLDENNTVLSSNMKKKYMEELRRYLTGKPDRFSPYQQFYIEVTLSDKTRCILQYDYSPQYASTLLRELLPDFQMLYGLLGLAAAVFIIFLSTRRYARLLARDARLLTKESERVAARQLEDAKEEHTSASVREFAQALEAIHTLKTSLSDSLREQWRSQQERADAMAALAHDLKTPLTVISGNAELLLEELPADSPMHGWAQAVVRNADYAADYVKRLQMLAVSSPETEKQTFDAGEFFHELTAQCENICRSAGCRLRLSSPWETDPPAASVLWKGRRTDLLRAVCNIMDNAARFSSEGSDVELSLELTAQEAVFCIHDHGPGFSARALAMGTQQFFTGDESRNREEAHTGLGLYFAESVARAHGGALVLGNRDEGGAEVWVRVRV